jgi:predicted dehydrogenase
MLAAAEAGKHVFAEAPVATDPAGCRLAIEASRIAGRKGLAVAVGTQRRHEQGRAELVGRIHDGAIGDLVGGQCYGYGPPIPFRGPREAMSEIEWQCHNWAHFTWLSGGPACNGHVHGLDVMNWCFKGPPAKFMGVGGRGCLDYERQAREACAKYNKGSDKDWPKYAGDIWDHVFAELEYPGGARCLSISGYGPGGERNGDRLVGTRGTSDGDGGHDGETAWRYAGPRVDGRQRQHGELIRSIRAGTPLNEGKRAAESTLTAIGARMASATGRSFTWTWLLNSSTLALVPKELEKGPGIFHPVATGRDPLV